MSRLQILLLIALFAVATAGAAVSNECLECHGSTLYKVQQPKLFKYFESYRNSVHGEVGIGCEDCHGGDPGCEELEPAHLGVMERVRFDNIPATCGECHEEQRDHFLHSDHNSLLTQDGSAPNCVTCHGAMEAEGILVSQVKNTCLFCHNQESGNQPDLPDRAESILGKINIIKGYKSYVAANSQDKKLVEKIETDYNELISFWHSFDLQAVGTKTEELLVELRAAKKQAMREKRR